MKEFADTILCIEDDRETAALIAEDLSERGYDVGVAHDGDAGFAAIMRLHPSLVLCDLVMPTSGFEVLSRVTRSAPQFRDLPFIFLSAMTDRDIELKARRLGADDFVAKPVDFDVLAAIVRARLARVARTHRPEAPPGHGRISRRETEAMTATAMTATAMTATARSKPPAELVMGWSRRTTGFHFGGAGPGLDTAIRPASRLITP